MARSAVRLLVACLLVILSEAPALPQADVASGTLRGTVTDPTGALVPGATVTVKDVARGITRTGASDGQGAYQVRLLQPGAHEVRVAASGFRTHVADKIEVSVGQIVVFDVQLQVGALADEVLVSAAPPLVETERSQQSNTIGERQIVDYPNVGRDFTNYVFSLPGVSSSNAPRAQFPGFTFGSSGFSIGGSNGRSNLVTVDGGENEYGSGQLRNGISIEAVQEFQVNRNAFNAEFGFTVGTAINVITRSGTNDFHGSGYIFYRSQKTSARNFFDRNPRKAFDQQMYPGLTFGGPIRQNRLFFFTSYEVFKSDAARFRRYTDNPAILGPTAAQAAYLGQMDASADANIRRVGAGLRSALTAASFPNTTMKLLRDNEGTFTAPVRLHNWMARADYQISSQDSLNARFSIWHSDSDQLGIGNSIAPTTNTDLFSRDYTILAGWNRNLTASALNQLRVQLVPNNSARTISKAPNSTGLTLPGIGTFGRIFSAPFSTFQDRYQFEDVVSWVRGKHSFKFGGSYRPVNYHVINELWFGGLWNFAAGVYPAIVGVPAADQPALVGFNRSISAPDNGPAAANLSVLQSFSLGYPFLFRQGFGNPDWQDWAHFLGTFVQDSWKIKPRFTLDYGVRFDFDREPKPLGFYKNVSPRLGFAWDPFGDHKTVIRAGSGFFFSPVYYQVAYVTNLLNDSGRYINQVFTTPAFGATQPVALWGRGAALGKLPFQALSQSELNGFGLQTGRGAPGRVLFDAAKDYKNPYSIQASFGITRQIASDLSVEVAYQFYKSIHLQIPHEINYRESGVDAGPGLGPRLVAIDPTITQFNLYSSIGNSQYHGATLSLNKRYARHSQFGINYTFSRAIDDVTDFNSAFAAFLPTRLRLEKGLSAFHVKHNFNASGVFHSPWKAGEGVGRLLADITFSPVIFLRSGIPFTVRIGSDINGDTHGDYDRPFLAGRNTGFGENFYGVDARLSKKFHIRRDSGLHVEFVAEGTNLFNHTNFLGVNDVVGNNPSFLFGPFNLRGNKQLPSTAPLGFHTAADARRIQFGLKVVF